MMSTIHDSIIKLLQAAKVARLLSSEKFMMLIKSNITQRTRGVLYTTIEVQILVHYFYYQVLKNHNIFMF
jgi:hypothetical protein